MTRRTLLQADSLAVLRHIEVHGSRTCKELKHAIQLPNMDRTLHNLVRMTYVVEDTTTKPISYSLCNKARTVLSQAQQVQHDVKAAHGGDRTGAGRKPKASTRQRASALQAAQRLLGAGPVVAPRDHGQPMKAPPYEGSETALPSLRPNSMDAYHLPSRMGNRLHYRSGLVTDMAGHVITPATTD